MTAPRKPEPHIKTGCTHMPTSDIEQRIRGIDVRIDGLERLKYLAKLELKRRKRHAPQ